MDTGQWTVIAEMDLEIYRSHYRDGIHTTEMGYTLHRWDTHYRDGIHTTVIEYTLHSEIHTTEMRYTLQRWDTHYNVLEPLTNWSFYLLDLTLQLLKVVSNVFDNSWEPAMSVSVTVFVSESVSVTVTVSGHDIYVMSNAYMLILGTCWATFVFMCMLKSHCL